MKKIVFGIIILLISISFIWPANVASGATTPQERLKSYEKHLEMKDNSIFKKLQWREIGPYFMGGRIVDIEGYEKNPYKFYIASASGGLWLTENNGATWTPLFDHESSITLGDIAISQTDENLIWAGTGEQNSSRSSYAGTGIFKSTDGGKTWQNMGLTDTHHISRIIIDPLDNNTVYAAAIGHLYTYNEERGLFKTTDGGKTWEKILYISPKTGIIDLAMHPTKNNILFAAAWQRERKAWNFWEGGKESAIYKSVDSGKTWEKISGGFPQNEYVGRIGLAISHSNPNTIYAFLDNQEPKPTEKDKKKSSNANENLFNTNIKGAEIYRSNDLGKTWNKTHSHYLESLIFTYGYYFGNIRVSPADENTIYVMGVPLIKSTDGGKTFKDISNFGLEELELVHADMHALWINPQNPKHLILGNDGCLNISYDEGTSWQLINNIPLAQCYTIHFDYQKPYYIYTGLQDNGVNRGPSNYKLDPWKKDWKMILWGDGAFVQPHPENPDIVFAEFQYGNICRLDIKNQKKSKLIQPKSPDKKSPYRFNWLSPFLISHHNADTLYMGGNKVLKSVDQGEHWLEISPDLSNRENIDGDVPYATITALEESELIPELLYAGTDDGNVWVKMNPLSPWEKIDTGLPQKWVTRIVPSKFKKERVYITQTGYREDDFKTYVYVSEDYGKNWTSIKGNLPDEPVNVIREDPENENILYLGTDLTIYVTLDRGAEWYSLKNDLPTNAVYDLRIHPREKELMIATHGRGVFIMPVDKIRLLATDIRTKPLYLFDIPAVTLVNPPFSRQEPLTGYFYSKKADNYQIIIQKDTQDIYKFEVEAVQGINGFSWNLIIDKEKQTKISKGKYSLILKNEENQVEGTFKVN